MVLCQPRRSVDAEVRTSQQECRGIADRYDVVAVEDINMKVMSRCMYFGKSVLDNSYGKFREAMLTENNGK